MRTKLIILFVSALSAISCFKAEQNNGVRSYFVDSYLHATGKLDDGQPVGKWWYYYGDDRPQRYVEYGDHRSVINAQFFTKDGVTISAITNGCGLFAHLTATGEIQGLQQYSKGVPSGVTISWDRSRRRSQPTEWFLSDDPPYELLILDHRVLKHRILWYSDSGRIKQAESWSPDGYGIRVFDENGTLKRSVGPVPAFLQGMKVRIPQIGKEEITWSSFLFFTNGVTIECKVQAALEGVQGDRTHPESADENRQRVKNERVLQ